jgi:uncharacterized protein YdiU (UPF0061 family)
LKQKDIGFRFDNSYLSLRQMFYRIQKPETVKSPALAVFNRPLAKRLGLDADVLFSSEGVEILVGNRVLPGAALIAQAYAGHQFGQFTMLGDGRALLIGEHQTPDGEKFDIQLKGSERPFHAAETAALQSDRCCGNTSSARPCMRWVYPRPEALPS